VPAESCCPRCGAPLQPPNLMHSDYRCSLHGSVAPLQRATLPELADLPHALADAAVPVWLPWPLPDTWLFTGMRVAGDDPACIRATAIGLTGQGLSDGPSDLIIVAEEPGTGMGAHLAGIEYTDPGGYFLDESAVTKVHANGWPTPLWSLPVTDRAVYVGEAGGHWLWLIAWPETAWSVIHSDLHLIDLRDPQAPGDVPTGALMPRLAS
jgi:hypothetical protein